MKKSILFIVALTASLALKAQFTEQKFPQKDKINYSFAWGLFKSKEYPKGKRAIGEFKKPEFSTFTTPASDTKKYEQKSILWGAIQWTENKKGPSPSNKQNNEQ